MGHACCLNKNGLAKNTPQEGAYSEPSKEAGHQRSGAEYSKPPWFH
jgi:hypothetical protein